MNIFPYDYTKGETADKKHNEIWKFPGLRDFKKS